MKDAAEAWRHATELDAGSAEAWFQLGRAMLTEISKHGEGLVLPPEVEDAFRKCIEAEPNSEYAAQARQLLEEIGSGEPSKK